MSAMQHDLFDDLDQATCDKLSEHLARSEYCQRNGIRVVPEPEFLAAFVRFQRFLRDWKQVALASFAGVSLSTVERVERGEPVSNEYLDRIAIAFGYQKGDFTEPRVPMSANEFNSALSRWLAPFEGRCWIDVEPIRKHRQIRNFADCHTYLIDGGRIDEKFSDDITQLWEWIDLVSFVRDDFIERGAREKRRVERRKLYNEVLAHIHEIERRAYSVALGGVYEAKTNVPLLPKANVAVIGFFPKMTDPGAIRRRTLCVPEQIQLSS